MKNEEKEIKWMVWDNMDKIPCGIFDTEEEAKAFAEKKQKIENEYNDLFSEEKHYGYSTDENTEKIINQLGVELIVRTEKTEIKWM